MGELMRVTAEDQRVKRGSKAMPVSGGSSPHETGDRPTGEAAAQQLEGSQKSSNSNSGMNRTSSVLDATLATAKAV
jgi:hypothetical protein